MLPARVQTHVLMKLCQTNLKNLTSFLAYWPHDHHAAAGQAVILNVCNIVGCAATDVVAYS